MTVARFTITTHTGRRGEGEVRPGLTIVRWESGQVDYHPSTTAMLETYRDARVTWL